jgi:hypothetical protein
MLRHLGTAKPRLPIFRVAGEAARWVAGLVMHDIVLKLAVCFPVSLKIRQYPLPMP